MSYALRGWRVAGAAAPESGLGAPGRRTLTSQLAPRWAETLDAAGDELDGARPGDRAGYGWLGGRGEAGAMGASGARGASEDPFAMHLGVVQARAPEALLGEASQADGESGGGIADAVGARVHRGPATRMALEEIGARGAAMGDRVFVGDDDPRVLAHEVGHVAAGDGGGGEDAREQRADRFADAWMTAPGAPMGRAAPGGTPLSFYAGHAINRGGGSVVVRATPGGDVVVRVPSGTPVEVGEEQAGWLHVTIAAPPAEGWIRRDLIADDRGAAPAAPQQAAPQQAAPQQAAPQQAAPQQAAPQQAAPQAAGAAAVPNGPAQITGSGVHLRATPDAHGADVGERLGQGTYVSVIGGDATWTQVTVAGRTGYVSRPLVAPVARDGTDAAVVERETMGLLAHSESSDRAGHYTADSRRVNIGLGSWTGGRIAGVMRRYQTHAQAAGQLAALHQHFGGEAHWTELLRRFSDRASLDHVERGPDGRAAWTGPRLTPEEIQQFESAEQSLPFVRAAEEEQLHVDYTAYLTRIARVDAALGPTSPFHFIDAQGTASQLAVEILANVAHEHGSLDIVPDIARSHAAAGEEAILRAVAASIVEMVVRSQGENYRRGVTNRYERLFARFGGSPRRVPVTPAPVAAQPAAPAAQPAAPAAQPAAPAAQPAAPAAQPAAPQPAAPQPAAPAAQPAAPAAQPAAPAAQPAAPPAAGALAPGPAYATETIPLEPTAARSSHPVTTLRPRDVVEVIGGDAEWTELRRGSHHGFARTSHLASGAAPGREARAAEDVLAPATGPLAHDVAVRALNAERREVTRHDPVWIAALQAALGVDAAARTGALNEATVQRVAEFQVNRMQAPATGRLDGATLGRLGEVYPALATGRDLAHATGGVDGPWADDAALRAQFTSGRFLGVELTAHPILLDRLAAGEAYLRQRFPSRSPMQLREMLGVGETYGVLRGGGSYHAKGWAIDINYSANPWVGGQAASLPADLRGEHLSDEQRERRRAIEAEQNHRNDEALAIIWRAAWLTGRGESYSTADMAARSGRNTTEQIWEHAHAVSTELHDYLAAASNPQPIDGWIRGGSALLPLASRPAPPRPSHSHANHGPNSDTGTAFTAPLHEDLRTGDAAAWQAQIAADVASYRSRGSNFEMTGRGPRDSLTVTDHHLELVRALRDAGGLAWGGSDIEGEQSGDFMHFDTRTVAACRDYMATQRAARSRH